MARPGAEEARPATVADLKLLLRSLNEQNVDYLLIGGYALYALGYQRGTTDIDVLLPPNREQGERVRRALLVLPDDNMTYNGRAKLLELLQQQRIPAIFGAREFVDIGGLMSYGPSLSSNYRHAAVYLDKVLRGSRPADLPVEQPTKFELVINLKTAKALGLKIPQLLLLRADEVIQ